MILKKAALSGKLFTRKKLRKFRIWFQYDKKKKSVVSYPYKWVVFLTDKDKKATDWIVRVQ